jgi:hypothetical protein
MRSFIGQTLEAITLNAVHSNPNASSHAGHSEPRAAAPQRGENARGISGFEFTEALTDNYQKLYLKGRYTPNRWIAAHIDEVEDGALVGSVVPA